jgi:hypothetical protein
MIAENTRTPNPSAPLLCVRCEYDVTSIAPDGVCPECGLERTHSAMGGALAGAAPEYLRSLMLGLNQLIWACFMTFIAAMLLAASELIRDPRGDFGPILAILTAPSVFAASLLAVLGTWTLCKPDPRPWLQDRFPSVRSVCRWSAITPAIPLVALVPGASMVLLFGMMAADFSDWAVGGTLGAGLLFWLLMVGWRIARIGARVPSTPTVHAARWFMVIVPALGGCIALAASSQPVLALCFGALGLMLCFGLLTIARKHLRPLLA